MKDQTISKNISNTGKTELERLRQYFELVQSEGKIGIWDWDAATDRTYWSSAMWRFYGERPDSQNPDQIYWGDRLHPDDKERTIAKLDRTLASKRTDYTDVFRVVAKNGRVRSLESVAVIERDENGKAVRMFGTCQDVTDRSAIEERSRRSEVKLQLVTDSIPALVSYIDADKRYAFVNARYTEWFGQPQEHFIGKKMSSVTGRSAYKQIKPYVDRALAGETIFFESELTYKFAGHRFISAAYVPDIDHAGNVLGFYVFVHDITDLKRSEHLFRSSQERIKMLMESFTDYAIFSTDIKGTIDTWNPGGTNIFGYTEEEILGQPIGVLFTPEDNARGAPAKEMRVARTKGRASDERWHIRKDGSRFFASGVLAPLYVDGVLSGYAKIVTDLTEKKRIAEELQQAYDEMEIRVLERTRELANTNSALMAVVNERKTTESVRIKLLQRLVTSQEDERRRIARDIHDHLGQRLTALRLKIASLREACTGHPDLRQRATRLQQIAEMLDSEVSFLAWELRPTALDELGLSDAIGTFVREWSRHYSIPADFQPAAMAKAHLDRDAETHLYRITQEALNNIVKHAQAKNVTVLLENTGNDVILIVEDDGVGFLVRNESESRRNGRNLGLKGMRERAILMGGMLEIESSPGRGTTIYVRVPHEPEQTEL